MTDKGKLILYHGSENIVRDVIFGKGSDDVDFGKGFYCTDNIDLAKEWACQNGNDGYANKYSLDLTNLRVFNIEENLSTLEWFSFVLRNRTFENDFSDDKFAKILEERMYCDLSEYDILTGYRADDGMKLIFSNFIHSQTGCECLDNVLKLGNFGTQIVLKSRKSFERIKFMGYETAKAEIWTDKYNRRILEANKAYGKLLEEERDFDNLKSAMFLNDLIRDDSFDNYRKFTKSNNSFADNKKPKQVKEKEK